MGSEKRFNVKFFFVLGGEESLEVDVNSNNKEGEGELKGYLTPHPTSTSSSCRAG